MKYDFKKIKAAREDKRLTKTELARRVGLSLTTVVAVEKGRAPWLKAIRKIEKYLGVAS